MTTSFWRYLLVFSVTTLDVEAGLKAIIPGPAHDFLGKAVKKFLGIEKKLLDSPMNDDAGNWHRVC